MLDPQDLIQDEIEHPEQTRQLQKSYIPLKANQQSILRIRTRLLEQRAHQIPSPSRKEEQVELLPDGSRRLKMPTEHTAIGQFLPVVEAQSLKNQYPRRSWRFLALVAVICAAILSGTIYAISAFPVPAHYSNTSQTTPTPQPYKLTSITDITMTSATIGWARAQIEKKGQFENSIVHTIDGGKTWQAFDFHGQPAGLIGRYFLNDQTAWVIMGASLDPKSKVPLMRTTDGGKHWTELSLPPGMDSITFLDQQHGWAWSISPLQGVSESRTLYSTADGGKTWQKLGSMSTERTVDDGTLGALPFCNGVNMSFLTPQRGWAVIKALEPSQSIQQVVLYLTQDGGKTWQKQLLPQPTSGPIPGVHTTIHTDGAYIVMRSPKFVTPQQGMLSIVSQKDKQSPHEIYLYTTHNGGLSWSLQGSPIEDTGARQAPVVLDATHFLLVSEHAISAYLLENGQWKQQTSWHRTEMVAPESPSFVDPQRGWVSTYESSKGKNISILWETTNGGFSWHEVMRIVADSPPDQQGG